MRRKLERDDRNGVESTVTFKDVHAPISGGRAVKEFEVLMIASEWEIEGEQHLLVSCLANQRNFHLQASSLTLERTAITDGCMGWTILA